MDYLYIVVVGLPEVFFVMIIYFLGRPSFLIELVNAGKEIWNNSSNFNVFLLNYVLR